MDGPQDALLSRWLHCLQATDVEGLAALYAPDATVCAASETWCGRDEITDGLTMIERYLRALAVERVEAAPSEAGITFETWVRGKIGRAHVRHHWDLAGGQIRGHTMELLRRKHVPAGA